MRLQRIFTLTSLLAMGIVNLSAGAPVNFATRRAIELNNPVITLADINKDGHTDIIAAIASTTGNDFQVSIQLGSSNGTFTQGPTIDLGPSFVPTAIATGDFNGDGLLDIAVLSNSLHALDIISQDLGGFTITPIQIAEDTSQRRNIGVADMMATSFQI